MLKLAASLILVFVAVRTLSYAVYEKRHDNLQSAVGLIIFAFLALIAPMVVVWLRF